MPTTTYTNFENEVVEQNRAGTIRDFVPNPLGSTVALMNSSQTKTDTWTYWPYGDPRSTSSGSSLRFVGTLGYYADSYLTYVRARYYKTGHGRWLSVDPLWPEEKSYAYSGNNPTTDTDMSGTSPQLGTAPPPPPSLLGAGYFTSGYVFVDCRCKGAYEIWVLAENGDLNTSPPCGKWIKADAVVIGQTMYKIQGNTGVHVDCPPDDERGCHPARLATGYYGPLSTSRCNWCPKVVDFCKEFCGRPCPPACRRFPPKPGGRVR